MIAGKYVAGLITAAFFFCGSIALSFRRHVCPFSGSRDPRLRSRRPGHSALARLYRNHGLACMAYGALFLWLGIRYKNPIIPAVVLLFWESFNIFLPSWLKKVSILYYLRSLTPVDPGILMGLAC